MIDPAVVYLHCKMRHRTVKRYVPRSSKGGYPVQIRSSNRGTLPANFHAPATAQAAEVAIALRERGWLPYRVWLDSESRAWIAHVIDWGRGA
jgi:hypothetical protein